MSGPSLACLVGYSTLGRFYNFKYSALDLSLDVKSFNGESFTKG